MLVIPPILFTLLHEIFVRQEHSAFRDGICLAALLVVQFFISPEVLVICALLGVIGLVPVLVVGWRQLRVRAWHALPGADARPASSPPPSWPTRSGSAWPVPRP